MDGTLRKLIVIVIATLLAGPVAATALDGTAGSQLIVPGAAVAQEENEDEDDNGDEVEDDDDRPERSVEISVSGTQATFRMEREDAAGEQEVELTYNASEGEMELEFERETNGTEESLSYQVEFERILEYQDTNGNEVFDEGTDLVLSSYQVPQLEWTLGNVEDVKTNGQPGKAVTGLGEIPDTNGTFSVRLLAFGSFVNFENLTLRPTDVKVDLTWTDYPWTSPNSRLALLSEVETETEVEVEEGARTPALNASFGNVSAYFAWAEQAEVDGEIVPVHSKVTQEEQEEEQEEGEARFEAARTLQLSYPQGDRILHDPVVGVQYAEAAAPGDDAEGPGAGGGGIPAPGMVPMLLAGLAAATLLRRHRRDP